MSVRIFFSAWPFSNQAVDLTHTPINHAYSVSFVVLTPALITIYCIASMVDTPNEARQHHCDLVESAWISPKHNCFKERLYVLLISMTSKTFQFQRLSETHGLLSTTTKSPAGPQSRISFGLFLQDEDVRIVRLIFLKAFRILTLLEEFTSQRARRAISTHERAVKRPSIPVLTAIKVFGPVQSGHRRSQFRTKPGRPRESRKHCYYSSRWVRRLFGIQVSVSEVTKESINQ